MARIVFFGTPDISLYSLEALCNSNHQIIEVFTKEPKPANRGKKINNSPILDFAINHNLKFQTPHSLRTKEYEEYFANLDYDFSVVVAYGLILPKHVLNAPKFGSINIHPSSLPKYRGPSPIVYTILNGDTETDICSMLLDEGMDTGDILIRRNIKLKGDEYSHDLHHKLFKEGSNILIETIDNFEQIKPKKQDDSLSSITTKITKEMGKINWEIDTAEKIYNKVRAFNPWPSAYFLMNNEEIKIIQCNYLESENQNYPVINKDTILAKKGILTELIVQRPGKKPMGLKEMLNGMKEMRISTNTD